MVPKLIIHMNYCLTPFHRIHNAAIIVEGEYIRAVGGISAIADKSSYVMIDLPDTFAVPGFVDTHISGAAGFDCMHADESPERFREMSRALAQHGVTVFTPTTQSASPEKTKRVVQTLADIIKSKSQPGAIPIGIHFDGPFLNHHKRGAHPLEYLQEIDLRVAEEFLQAAQGTIKIFTFSPELDHAVELTRLLKQRGISPCMGHTEASEEQIIACIQEGADRCLHLYNAMEPLRQRRVGLAAIALTHDDIWVEIIPDGIHSHWGMLKLACRCKNKAKLIAISNATEAAGLPDGCYHLGDQTIYVRDGKVNLKDGTIAGSTNFLDENFRNLLIHGGLTQEEAVASCSYNPSRSLGLYDRGEIKPGKRADLTILDTVTAEVRMTLINGKIAYVDPEILDHLSLDSQFFTEDPRYW